MNGLVVGLLNVNHNREFKRNHGRFYYFIIHLSEGLIEHFLEQKFLEILDRVVGRMSASVLAELVVYLVVLAELFLDSS